SPHGLTGAEFLVDHVHLSFEGNYLLAGLIGQQIGRVLSLIDPAVKRPWPTMAECARAVALTGWDRYQLVQTMRGRLSKRPFDHQLFHAATLQALATQLKDWEPFTRPDSFPAWKAIYEGALAAAPGDWLLHAQYAKLLENFKVPQDAVREWRQVVRLVPEYAIGHYQLARLLDRGPDRAEARQQALEALRWWPDFPQALNSLGIALAHDEQFSEACRRFERALELDPYLFNAQINWAMTLEAAGRSAAALTHYSNAVSLQPENPDLHFRLGVALAKQGNRSDAIAQLRETLRLDPNHPGAREQLTRLEGLLSTAPAPVGPAATNAGSLPPER
ncbi:MAG: tetratricopeptide repeat protein, partial [Verrucomicrobia bacterium]|nr:tetratricopeptide repeat protein [Verrucomicrobiota bacterium]